MKKLLITILVLGMTSLAGAALQLSVNGLDPIDSEIFLTPSETLIIEIFSDIPISPQGEGEGQWALTVAVADATVSGGIVALSDADWEIGILDDPVGSGVTGVPAGENGVWGWIYTFGKDIPADTAIYEEIVLHCELAFSEAVINLWQLDDFAQVTNLLDQVVVHQIPEPASMALLGLGGLVLLRKRRS